MTDADEGMTASQPSRSSNDGRPDRQSLDRLLRSASQNPEELSDTPPFGFETRVVALWRSGTPVPNGNGGLARLLRRVAIAATVVIVVSSAAAFYQINDSRSRFNEPLTNDFALADSFIQDEVW